ncbi:hypothetical protein RJ641_025243 [Dillenia turbinata]|uniref:Uncharacterized protein n=1 Tax=Dillenia turbinata TaxID=194707 RepID=A0AAN8WA23_9MAGN
MANWIAKTLSLSADWCSTRRVVRSHCNTEEVEPGNFVRRCEKTEQLFKESAGSLHGNNLDSKGKGLLKWCNLTRSTLEEDVTDEVVKGYSSLGSSDAGPFSFPGLHSSTATLMPWSETCSQDSTAFLRLLKR